MCSFERERLERAGKEEVAQIPTPIQYSENGNYLVQDFKNYPVWRDNELAILVHSDLPELGHQSGAFWESGQIVHTGNDLQIEAFSLDGVSRRRNIVQDLV
jgi:hypothetical protein